VSCCATCAFRRDSVVYCARCAEFELDAAGLPLNLVAAVGSLAAPANRRPAKHHSTWLIVVARSQLELLEHLKRAFAGDPTIEIVMDRRRDSARTSHRLRELLEANGAVALRRLHPPQSRS
jgi:hypothetical protein